MKNIHDMTIPELIKLGYKIVVTEPPHDKDFGYFFYDGKPIGKSPRPVVWLKSESKGEQKVIHTHEIEVFGAPCDCGTRHEYCGECSWVEPCEPEGEQK